MPLLVSNAETEPSVMLDPRTGTAHAVLSAAENLEYLVERTRTRFPEVRIAFRGDGGFAVPARCAACEWLGVECMIGLGASADRRGGAGRSRAEFPANRRELAPVAAKPG